MTDIFYRRLKFLQQMVQKGYAESSIKNLAELDISALKPYDENLGDGPHIRITVYNKFTISKNYRYLDIFIPNPEYYGSSNKIFFYNGTKRCGMDDFVDSIDDEVKQMIIFNLDLFDDI